MDTRMPNEHEARAFKTHVLEAAASWLRNKPALEKTKFDVEVNVEHVANASEDLSDYFSRDTGDEAK